MRYSRLETWLAPRPAKRQVQEKLNQRLRKICQKLPMLSQGTIISLAGADLGMATKGYQDLATKIYVAEKDLEVWEYIHELLTSTSKDSGRLEKVFLVRHKDQTLDVVDVVNHFLEENRTICGLDLDFDEGEGSPISKYIEWIEEKFFGQISSPAFWLRIMVPARALTKTHNLETVLHAAKELYYYNIIDCATGPTYSYKDTAPMKTLQLTMQRRKR